MTEQPAAPDLAALARRMAAAMRATAGALQVMNDRFAELAAAIESAADYQSCPDRCSVSTEWLCECMAVRRGDGPLPPPVPARRRGHDFVPFDPDRHQ